MWHSFLGGSVSMAWQWRFFVFKACDVNDSYWTVNVEMNVWQRRDNYRRETEKRHLRDVVRDGAIRPSRSVVAARESLSGVFRGSLEAYSPGAGSQVSGRSDILVHTINDLGQGEVEEGVRQDQPSHKCDRELWAVRILRPIVRRPHKASVRKS